MNKKDEERLKNIEKRIKEIAVDQGLLTTDIIFEIAPSEKVLEGMSYWFPENFSYWQHGRDYERNRTIYEHTGHGIPYEQVWNFEKPKAYVVETNPIALIILTMAHVFGHVDFFLASKFLKVGRDVSDVAREAKSAAIRFEKYEELYGIDEVEKVMDAADSIRWHQNRDIFADEARIDEEDLRKEIILRERAKFEFRMKESNKQVTPEEIKSSEARIKYFQKKTPVEPRYDILYYIQRHSKALTPWMEDIISVMREQARHLAPNMRTKMLNEGWASYWHLRIVRQLFDEGLLTTKEHAEFVKYHSGVIASHKKGFNPYRLGLKLFEDVEERWNKGRYGREYEECTDAYKRANWDIGAMRGREKIFEIRANYSDRMAVENFFTDDFIHEQKLYLYGSHYDEETEEIVDIVEETNPTIIRMLLLHMFSNYGTPIIRVEDGDSHGNGELVLSHRFKGFPVSMAPYLELNPPEWREETMKKMYFLWGKPVHIDTFDYFGPEDEGERVVLVRYSYDGSRFHREAYRTVEIRSDMKTLDW